MCGHFQHENEQEITVAEQEQKPVRGPGKFMLTQGHLKRALNAHKDATGVNTQVCVVAQGLRDYFGEPVSCGYGNGYLVNDRRISISFTGHTPIMQQFDAYAGSFEDPIVLAQRIVRMADMLPVEITVTSVKQ